MSQTNSTTTQQAKTRGRPKGSKTGPRSVIWVGVNFAKSIIEKIYSPKDLSEEDVKGFSSDQAKEIFVTSFGCEPDELIGPFHDKKTGIANTAKTASESDNVLTVNVNSITGISNALGEAEHNDWKGRVFAIEGRDDVVLFIPQEDLTGNKNRNMPAAMPIAKNNINII